MKQVLPEESAGRCHEPRIAPTKSSPSRSSMPSSAWQRPVFSLDC